MAEPLFSLLDEHEKAWVDARIFNELTAAYIRQGVNAPYTSREEAQLVQGMRDQHTVDLMSEHPQFDWQTQGESEVSKAMTRQRTWNDASQARRRTNLRDLIDVLDSLPYLEKVPVAQQSLR